MDGEVNESSSFFHDLRKLHLNKKVCFSLLFILQSDVSSFDKRIVIILQIYKAVQLNFI